MHRSSAALLCGAAALAAYALVIRPGLLWWGSTRAERGRTWPGDEMAGARTRAVSMRAVTIDAPTARVWPLIVRIGEDAVQQRFVGDTVWLSPRGTRAAQARLVVGYLEANQAMILIAPEDWQRQIHGKPIAGGTWGFIVQPAGQNRTRLLVRSVWGRGPLAPARLLQYFREPAQFIMERRMMQQIKSLAERPRAHGSREEEPAVRRALRGLF